MTPVVSYVPAVSKWYLQAKLSLLNFRLRNAAAYSAHAIQISHSVTNLTRQKSSLWPFPCKLLLCHCFQYKLMTSFPSSVKLTPPLGYLIDISKDKKLFWLFTPSLYHLRKKVCLLSSTHSPSPIPAQNSVVSVPTLEIWPLFSTSSATSQGALTSPLGRCKPLGKASRFHGRNHPFSTWQPERIF